MILALALATAELPPLPENCQWVKKPVAKAVKAPAHAVKPQHKLHALKRKEELDITCKDVMPPVGLSVVEMSVPPIEPMEPVTVEPASDIPTIAAESDVQNAVQMTGEPTFSSYSYTAPLYIDTAISFRAVPAVPEVPSWVLLIAGLILFPAIKRRKAP